MGLIILIVIGVILGWLATVILRIEDSKGILSNMIAGVIGSVAAGLVAGQGTIFAGVSAVALGCAIAAAAVLIAALNLARRRGQTGELTH